VARRFVAALAPHVAANPLRERVLDVASSSQPYLARKTPGDGVRRLSRADLKHPAQGFGALLRLG
jgi:hypothetical protein